MEGPGSGEVRYRVIEWIPDGDTIHLFDGTKVRLIGINAPEVAHQDEAAEPGGPEAQRFLRRFLEGKRIRLEVGEQPRDQYDRLLAHVFTRKGTNVNALLLRRGYAYAVAFPPNLKRAPTYFQIEEEARSNQRGIWNHPRYRLQEAVHAKDFRNSFRRLRGRVARVTTKRKYIYITLKEGLQAYLDKAKQDLFRRHHRKPSALTGQKITVRGWVHQRFGRPTILLRHPLQIEAVH